MTTRTSVAGEPGLARTARVSQVEAEPSPARTGRVNQKARTRAAIVRAAADLARDGAEITMPSVARAALVSEATAYRYFPDLVSLLLESDAGVWPDPAEALAPVADSADPASVINGGVTATVLPAGDKLLSWFSSRIAAVPSPTTLARRK